MMAIRSPAQLPTTLAMKRLEANVPLPETARAAAGTLSHRARFNMPNGFEFTLAEVGRGWAKTNGPIELNLEDSHAHFAELNITGTGVIR